MDCMYALGLLGSGLNFIGGGLLSYDAILVIRNQRTKEGETSLLQEMKARNIAFTLHNEKGEVLTLDTVDVNLLTGQQKRAVGGFLLITLGFVADFLTKL